MNKIYLSNSVKELYDRLDEVAEDAQPSIGRALARLREWLDQQEVEDIYQCKASLMETIDQYGRESRCLKWLMDN